MRLVALVAGGVLVAGLAGAAEPCGGRYMVAGQPLTIAGTEAKGASVTVWGPMVAIDGLCGTVEGKLRQGKKRTRLKARFRECSGAFVKAKLRLVFATATCDLVAAELRTKGTERREFGAAKIESECGTESSFAEIESRIFGARGCRTQTCHGDAAAGGLALGADVAHANLVNVSAVAAPEAMRVLPGDADRSFLYRKVMGTLDPDEGSRMPLVGLGLDPLELGLLRQWIEAGAPATGRVEDAPCLPKHVFEPAAPLSPPPGGLQLVLDGPFLAPGEEMEGCQWVQLPETSDFVVGNWEYSLNPGTHHFAVWEVRDENVVPPVGIFNPNDTACIGGGARFSISISGAPQAPYFLDGYPTGIGKRLKAGSYLGLNPHYFNEFDVPVQVKVWINLHPVAGTLEHEADTLLSIDAFLDGKGSLSIHVPPGETGSLRLRWPNTTGKPMHIFQLSSHQHQRGTYFEAWQSNGDPLFANADWAHPNVEYYDPPFVLQPGDYIEFECSWDNGVSRPVRRCGDSPLDTGCTPGEPVAVTFNVTAQDEMCFLTGQFYLE